MTLKNATLIAIIGQGISLLWYISLNIELFNWSPTLGLVMNFIGFGSLLIFLITLYAKQKD